MPAALPGPVDTDAQWEGGHLPRGQSPSRVHDEGATVPNVTCRTHPETRETPLAPSPALSE